MRLPSSPSARARWFNRALAGVGVAACLGVALTGPSERARANRALPVVSFAPEEAVLKVLPDLDARAATALVGRLEREPHFLMLGGTPLGLDTLGRIGAPAATPFLVKVVEGDLGVSLGGDRADLGMELGGIYERTALKALGRIGDPRAEPFLLREASTVGNLFTDRSAILGLAQLRTRRGHDALVELAASSDLQADRRLLALQGLAWCAGDDWMVDDGLALLGSLDDPWLTDRATASAAPAVPPRALAAFRELAADRPPAMREASLVAAGDPDATYRALDSDGQVVQMALTSMAFAQPFVAGAPKQRLEARYCRLAAERSPPAYGDAAAARRERRIALLEASICADGAPAPG